MIWQPARIPPNGLLLKMPYRFNRSHQFHVRNRSCALRDSIILQALQKEPAMNGTSGFGEVRSSTSRSSTNRFLRGQGYRSGTGSWRIFDAHNLIALCTGSSANIEKVSDTVLIFPEQRHNQERGSSIHFLVPIFIGAPPIRTVR